MKAQGPGHRVQKLRRLVFGRSAWTGRFDSLRRRIGGHKGPAVVAGAAATLIVVVTLAVLMSGDEEKTLPRGIEPPGFAVSPEGDSVARLAPLRVTFEQPPLERDGKDLLRVEPEVKGDYLWQSERTLVFQPEFPGLLRGFEYTMTVAPQPDAGLERQVVHKFTTADALTVASVIPAPDDEDVPRNAQLLVQFSRSVAPLTQLSAQSDTPVLVFDPPLAGTGEWLNTSLYRFVPDPALVRPNTRYQVRIPAGLSSAADGVLKDDYVWSFTTFRPALDSVTPDANTQYVGPAQEVVARFNQPMNRGSVEGGFSLKLDGQPVAGTFTWSDGDATMAFRPEAALASAARYELSLARGLRGANGGETITEWHSSFATVGPAGVVSTSPADGATDAGRFGVNIRFATPMDEDSLEGRIRVSDIEDSKIQTFMSPDQVTMHVNVSLKTSSLYRVSILEGAFDRYGQPLPAYSFGFRTGARQAQVTLAIPNDIATYSSSAEPFLFYHSVNSAEARFTLYPLTADEMNGLRTSRYIELGPRGFRPSQAPIATWTEDASGALDEVVLRSTSLSRGAGPLPKGDYYVDTGGPFRSAMAFSVVDTGIVTKLTYDALLAWAIDLDSGVPVAGVSLTATWGPLEGPNTVVTGSDGLARFRLPTLLGQTPYTSREYSVLLDDGGRYGVGSTTWSQGTDLFDLGLQFEYYPKTYAGHVYTDRPIYRPGEEVLYKGVIRRDDDADYSVPDKADGLTLAIADSEGKRLRTEPIALNEFGSFAGSLVLPTDLPTGDYVIGINWHPSNIYDMNVASWAFAVAEFRKPEFEVSVESARPDYVSGETIEASVRATFFFGGGVESAPVEWSASKSPFAPHFEGFERFSFTDYDYYRTQVALAPFSAREGGTTDGRGEFRFNLPATITGNEGPQHYTLSASVTDQSAQVAAGSTTLTVHPASIYAGVRPAQYVARAGAAAAIDLAVVGLDGTPVRNQQVAVNVYERTWITTKEATPNGARRYRSEPRDTLVTTLNARTNSEGLATASFTPEDPGTLRLVAEVTDSAGRTNRAASYLWVAGPTFASWQTTNDDSLKLIADRDEYSVGDTAKVLVPAPFAGATGLVTIERGKVHESYVRTFATNSETIEVPIKDSAVPNIYVGVVLYRGPRAEDPVSRYKVGYVELKVSTDLRVLNVSIKPDRDQAKPGETVHYDIEVTDSAGRGVRSELSVSVVDKAILALADERGPNGLLAFWFERGLGVRTASSLSVSVNRANDVISEAAGAGKGGGGLDDDRIRQDFRNSAYWQAQLVTDDRGRAGVDVVMPDNLTTWRMQVRAISGDILVGEGTSEMLSTQPVLLRPALPRFLRVGDQPSLRLLVRNATRDDTEVTVKLEAEGLELTDGTQRKVDVPAGQSAMVEWPAEAKAEGTAKLTFTAQARNGLKDAIVQEFPVYLDVTPETTATGGVVKTSPVEEAVYVPPYAILRHGSLQVSVQGSLTRSLGNDLADYQPTAWEGFERKASRIISTLAVARADKSAVVPFSREQLNSDVSALISGQRGDGGWAWCNSCPQTDARITAWVLIALGQWRQEGNGIDSRVLDRAASYVQSYVNRVTDVERPFDPNDKAYMLYALSVAGRADANLSTMRAVFEQSRAQLSPYGRAYLLLGLAEAGQTKRDRAVSTLLNDLASDVIPSANGNHWEDPARPGSLQSSPRTTAVVLRALTKVDPEHALIEETVRWLDIALRTNICRTSIERAEAILSLSEFAALTGELEAGYTYDVSIDDRELMSGELEAGPENGESREVGLPDLGIGTSIVTLARDSAQKGRMYYTLNLRYVTPAKAVEALNRGLAVSHEYSRLDDPNSRIDSARLSEVVRVKVTVIAPADRNYVVLEDLLPAGLEAIDPQLKTTDPALRARLEADRRAAAKAPELLYNAPWLSWYFTPWQQVDIRDDRVVVSAQVLPKGVYEFVYYARATTPGDFYVAPAVVEESYFPEVFGRGDSGRFTVEP